MRKKIRVYGIVQGVGFRPFVSRIADKFCIKGTVANRGSFVEIFAEGSERQLADFGKALLTEAPERSRILKIDEEFVDVEIETGVANLAKTFKIIESENEEGNIFVSPDIAVCSKCEKELFDKTNKRYLHPFINCTACGPRLTILDSMPYDRVRTSMKKFRMCPDCEKEYTNPLDRRYHAQPVCCPNCGPQLYTVPLKDGEEQIRGNAAIVKTREVIMAGGIAAIKGIGGFHLACDAYNEEAVARLRKLKARPYKALAVMLKNIDVAKEACEVDAKAEKVLQAPERPILLLEKKDDCKLAEGIAPENSRVGVMLPYTPLHHLLFRYPDGKEMTTALVMTSANPKSAPICKDDEDVLKNISHLCDIVLSNDRDIRLRADDSVASLYNDEVQMIRRSRGYAPLPVSLNGIDTQASVFGIGGELKSTFCIGSGDLMYMSPYVGDLTDLRTVNALREAVDKMSELLRVNPKIICSDMHPGYNSVSLAAELAAMLDIPHIKIQHHYAHILSCMAENQCYDEVIGICCDGTGYGTDGSIWGGEFLKASLNGFERLGCIESFAQPGGDLSAKEGWRVAVSILKDGLENNPNSNEENLENVCEKLRLCKANEASIISQMIDKNINAVKSSSTGRLFDAASAVLGLRTKSTCEGEAAMVLQYAAEKYLKQSGNSDDVPAGLGKIDSTKAEHETDSAKSLINSLAMRRLAGEDVGKLAYEFHKGLAEIIIRKATEYREKTNINKVALSGGVFVNLLFLSLCENGLRVEGFEVLTHKMIPANDGGIALGQALYATNFLSEHREKQI